MGNTIKWIFTSLWMLSNASLYEGFKPRLEQVRESANDLEQWGYSEVRKGAHMFWWLYRSTHPAGYLQRPLLIWLQGGPGFSSTAMGNFVMFGPLDEKLQPRNSTWVQHTNILFVDNPVGSGFSYLDEGTNLPNSSEAIAADLMAMLTTFLDKNQEFKTVPLFIFGQSYGGKMTVAFAERLSRDIEQGKIEANLTGVALGNAWISPIDSILNWAPLLLHMSVVDQATYRRLEKLAQDVASSIESTGYSRQTTHKWNEFSLPFLETSVDLYNILQYNPPYANMRKKRSILDRLLIPIDSLYTVDVKPLMEKLIRKKLAIIPPYIHFEDFNTDLYVTIEANDFLKPVVDEVDALLSKGVDVAVYQGQLDLVCPTNGAQDWLQKMKWSELPMFNRAERRALYNKRNETITFVKSYNNFKFYWILDAGHAVPYDTPDRAVNVLTRILNRVDN